jgi:hypothetical protein
MSVTKDMSVREAKGATATGAAREAVIALTAVTAREAGTTRVTGEARAETARAVKGSAAMKARVVKDGVMKARRPRKARRAGNRTAIRIKTSFNEKV